ncbi:MAG: hypothetical protein L6R35_005989 [Caloplaca aegaea]|nr:MAG: hypothetical protein L6R35_005989 [Caloplaca aegaea]
MQALEKQLDIAEDEDQWDKLLRDQHQVSTDDNGTTWAFATRQALQDVKRVHQTNTIKRMHMARRMFDIFREQRKLAEEDRLERRNRRHQAYKARRRERAASGAVEQVNTREEDHQGNASRQFLSLLPDLIVAAFQLHHRHLLSLALPSSTISTPPPLLPQCLVHHLHLPPLHQLIPLTMPQNHHLRPTEPLPLSNSLHHIPSFPSTTLLVPKRPRRNLLIHTPRLQMRIPQSNEIVNPLNTHHRIDHLASIILNPIQAKSNGKSNGGAYAVTH